MTESDESAYSADMETTPLLESLARAAADNDVASDRSEQAGDTANACLYKGSGAGIRLAADLLTNKIATLVVEHGKAADAGYRAGLAFAIAALGGSVSP